MASNHKLVFRLHAIKQMFERNISTEDVQQVIQHGEVIREYPEDKPFSSYLMLGWITARPLHVVAADNEEDEETIIITAYEPDPAIWETDFKRKKKQ